MNLGGFIETTFRRASAELLVLDEQDVSPTVRCVMQMRETHRYSGQRAVASGRAQIVAAQAPSKRWPEFMVKDRMPFGNLRSRSFVR
jgi:hypothetical protein